MKETKLQIKMIEKMQTIRSFILNSKIQKKKRKKNNKHSTTVRGLFLHF